MGMVYSGSFAGIGVTAQQDLFELVAPGDAIVVIHRCVITQSSDVGDSASEGLSLVFKRGQTTTGSGGQTPTPQPLEFGNSAAGTLVKTNDTTKASAGTIAQLHAENWIIGGPFEYLPTPETRIVLSPGQRFTVELATTPADSITMSGTIIFEEIGG